MPGILACAFLILMTLKLCGVISVSWLVVCIPIFVPIILWLGILFMLALAGLFASTASKLIAEAQAN